MSPKLYYFCNVQYTYIAEMHTHPF